MVDKLGTDTSSPTPPVALEAVRSILIKHCGAGTPFVPLEGCSTKVDAQLLEAWRVAAKDPDSDVCKRLREGAPAGIRLRPSSCSIFTDIDDSATLDPEDIPLNTDGFANYGGIEGNPVVVEEIANHLKAGHILAFDTLEELAAFLGENLILSKIGIVTKTRAGKTKHRFILDTKASNIKGGSNKCQRVLQPRLLDAIMQGLRLQENCDSHEEVEWFVLDFSEAFWQLPLHSQERKFFWCKLDVDGKTHYIVFLRTAQGSRGAPLTWARFAALLMRLTQSLFDPNSARMQCYVDDPITALKGCPAQRRLIMATMMLVWEALGCGLAFSKGQSGPVVDWIGGKLTITTTGIEAQVKESIINDIIMTLQDFAKVNKIGRADLESFIGKANHAAGLLVILRPFLQSLWAALYSASSDNCIWVRQIAHSLSWLQAVFYSSHAWQRA